ncbi:PAS domain S-box protein [Candidatus Halobeggiatoa sp. HSG11]|nr:PAS domain S-box protein [Candidatus Halobeggiatoa sp. HSG11]
MVDKILIVDDEPNNLALLHEYLCKANFKILIANNGKAALKRVEHIKPDLILLDIMMPEMGGFETCRQFKKNETTKDIPIIFITAKTDTVDKVKGFEIGAVDYVTKPFQHEELIARVNKHLTISRLRKQLEIQNIQLQEHVYHLQSLAALGQAINEAQDMPQMMNNAMKVTLSVFKSARAWLLYPCDPNTSSWRVPIEVTKPEYPGANVLNVDIPINSTISEIMKTCLSVTGPITFGPMYEYKTPTIATKQFSVQSQINMAIYPKIGKPWIFGIHQCSYAREWTKNELNLFRDFGQHISESLGTFLSLEELKKSEEKYSKLAEISPVGIFQTDTEGNCVYVNEKWMEISGLTFNEAMGFGWTDALYFEDKDKIFNEWYKCAKENIPFKLEYRFQAPNGNISWVIGQATAIKEAEKILGYVGTITDITVQKQAEEKLLETQAILQAAMDQSHAGIAIADAPDGKLRYVNDSGLNIRGKTKQEIVDGIGIEQYVKSWQILHFDGTPYKIDEVPLARAIMYGEACCKEFIVRRHDEEDRIVLANAAPIFDDKNEIFAGIVIFLDITERKQAEDALKESEHNLKKAQTLAHVGSWKLDITTNKVTGSDEFFNIFGLNHNEVTLDLCIKTVHPDDREYDISHIQKGIEYGTPWNIEHRLILKNGTQKWVHVIGKAIRNENGETVFLTGITQDITERKQVEEALAKSEQGLKDAQQMAQLGSWEFYPDKMTVKWSEQMFRLLGYEPGEIEANVEFFMAHIHPDDREYQEKMLAEIILNKENFSYEYRLIKKDGSICHIEANGRSYYDKKDNIIKMVGFLQDITRRKQIENELQIAKEKAEVANQTKSAFLASMSHELRTPLNGILGYVQILKHGNNLTNGQLNGLNIIHKSGNHLLAVINDVLDIAKIEAGKLELYLATTNLHNLLNDVSNIIKITDKKLKFIFEASEDLPLKVEADEKRLRQILLNLLGNAIKFTNEGYVALRIKKHATKQNLIRFEVQDTGVGMTPEQAKIIFYPFEQVGDKKKHLEGTGLGLSITNKLVNLMGSELKVSSEFGKGSTFWFEIAFQVLAEKKFVQPKITKVIKTDKLIAPSLTDLQALHELTMFGDLKRVQDKAKQLLEIDNKYMLFVQKIDRYAKEFDDEAILELIESAMNN